MSTPKTYANGIRAAASLVRDAGAADEGQKLLLTTLADSLNDVATSAERDEVRMGTGKIEFAPDYKSEKPETRNKTPWLYEGRVGHDVSEGFCACGGYHRKEDGIKVGTKTVETAADDERFTPRRLVHVRVLKEGESHVAQCLEYDITASAKTPIEALERWRVTAMGQVALDKRRGKEPLADIPCAPLPYWCGIKRDDLIGIFLDEVLKAEPVTKDQEVGNV